jgi:hypothetical protein
MGTNHQSKQNRSFAEVGKIIKVNKNRGCRAALDDSNMYICIHVMNKEIIITVGANIIQESYLCMLQ